MKKLIAIWLCFAMLLSLTACLGDTAAPTEASTEPAPTEPSAQELWTPAREKLEQIQDVTLAVEMSTVISVNGDEFSEKSVQTLTWMGLSTENLSVELDEKLYYAIHDETKTEEELEEAVVEFHEVYGQGTVYSALMDSYFFSAPMEQADAAEYYTPVLLLDEALYAEMTAESDEQGTTVYFSQPTAGESWAVPEEAELTEASGSATLSPEGEIRKMTYSARFTYGFAEYTLEVTSEPLPDTGTVTLPENSEKYVALEYPEIIKMSYRSVAMMAQADTMSSGSLESLYSQAAGVMRNQSTQMTVHGRENETKAKIETSIFMQDYTTRKSEQYEQEETYVDGKYTLTVNDGLPASQNGISWEDIRDYCGNIIARILPAPDFWESATATDMGSVYLIEFTLNENFGNTMQNGICEMLWEDPSFLVNLASKYENKEGTAYLSVDKYSGVCVAGGYSYKGVHTIQGQDYELSLQYDQSAKAPDRGAYKEITDKLEAETEPENKATPLFYHVTGGEGQEMWLLGTIHVGDVRTGFLPQEIRAAFEASDALALECDTEAFDKQLEEDDKLQEQVSNLYFFSNGKTLEDLVDEETYAMAVQFAKATGSYNMNMPYAKPCVWSDGIEQFYLYQGQSLHRDQGVERRLYAWAEELEKPIREVESNMFQVKMLTGFSNDLQILMLEDAMSGTGRSYWESVEELYELWCAGDENALIAELNEKPDLSGLTEEELAEYEAQKPLEEEYNKTMSIDRNKGMLKVAIQYLESDDVVFYAVGLAHLLDETNGLVQALRDAGYTVELVSYQ